MAQRRFRAAAAAACLVLAVAGCGGNGAKVPRGNPDSRHSPQVVDSYAQVEFLRALLIASSDSYYAGGSAEDARTQLRRARASYDQLAGRVKAADPVVDREVVARFDAVATVLRQGIPPDRYRDLVGPLADQLMDGVSQALVPPAGRADSGVPAEALRRVALRMSATYDAASSSEADTPSRLAFQEAWGLWRRAQALQSLLATDLGGQADRVANALDGLRQPAFPNGPLQPDQPPAAKVDAVSARIVQVLDRRFALAA